MPPLQTTTDQNDPKRLVKIKFIKNTADDGTDYGPDYPKKVAEVPFFRATNYIRTGRAIAWTDDDDLKEVEDAAREAEIIPETVKGKGK